MRELASKDGKQQGEQQKSSSRLNIFPPLPVGRGLTDGSTYKPLSTGPGLLRPQPPATPRSQPAPPAFSVLRALPSLMRTPAGALTVNDPNDEFEEEADRVADQVMRMPDPAKVQRTCSCSEEDRRLQRTCASCKEKEDEEEKNKTLPQVQRTHSSTGPAIAPPIVHEVLRSPGQPLDAGTRSFMEPRFGHSFSHIRVHADAKAAESAQAVDALAYTVGPDIVFSAGQYLPETDSGARLLAHELTHVLQQKSALTRTPFETVRRQVSNQQEQQPERLPEGLRIPWKGDIKTSLVDFFQCRAGEQGRQIALDLATNISHAHRFELYEPKAGKYNVEQVDRRTFQRRVAGFFILEDSPVWTKERLGWDPTDYRQIEAISCQPSQSRHDKSELHKEVQGSPTEPLHRNWSVLQNNKALSKIYLRLMEHFLGVSLRRVTEHGLTISELQGIVGKDKNRRHYTDLFTQGYVEFKSAGGKSTVQFEGLEEIIFEQSAWGNSNAIRNQLKIDIGWPENRLGITDRSSGMLYYDQNGDPLPSFVGLQMRDEHYIAVRPLTHRLQVVIDDATLHLLLNITRQQFSEPAFTIEAAAKAYFDNVETVKARVVKGLKSRVIKDFEDMLPVFAAFLAGHGLAFVLRQIGTPWTIGVAFGLEALLKVAGYLLDIGFVGHALEEVRLAGRHLSRVHKNAQGRLTAESQRHLDLAVIPIQAMISSIAQLAAGRLISFVIKIQRGERVEIKCSDCDFVDPKSQGSETKLEPQKVEQPQHVEAEATRPQKPSTFEDIPTRETASLTARLRALRGKAKEAEWVSPKQGEQGPGLRDHAEKHGEEVGANSVREYDLSARETIQNGRRFRYRDRSSNEPRVGYWDPRTGLFTATSETGKVAIILTHFRETWEDLRELPGFTIDSK